MSHPGERPPRATAATPKCRRPIGYHFPPMDPPPQPYPSPSKAQWAAVEEAELVRDDAVLGSVAVAVAVDEDAASPSSTAPTILGVVALRTRADNRSNPGHNSSSFWLHVSRVGVLSAACAAVRDWILPEAVGMGEVLVEYLVVAPSVRRRGVGRALLEWAAAEARCLVAADAEAVRAGSQPVLALWVRRPWFRGLRMGAWAQRSACAPRCQPPTPDPQVAASNTAALSLYARAGFLPTQETANAGWLVRAACAFFLGTAQWLRLEAPLGGAGGSDLSDAGQPALPAKGEEEPASPTSVLE